MSCSKLIATAAAVAAIMFAAVETGSAAKKLSYEQAFARCKQEIGANAPSSDVTSTAPRYTAGAGCMQKYGYRLKK